MRDYIVISDSTADLPISVVKELEVPIVPFSYSIEEQVYEYYLDEMETLETFMSGCARERCL